VYRIPVDLGGSCPNRDGKGKGGCAFCPENGGRAVQLGDVASPAEQVAHAIRFSRERYGTGLLQLYVQAYTATYTSVRNLRMQIEPLLDAHPFYSVSLGTRPDCLPPATLDLFRKWNSSHEVWIELGVQTTLDATLERIDRRHGWERSREAILRLHDAGLHVCAHLMFGLPGECADDMFESLERVVALPVDALKFHNLHILSDAPLGAEWRRRPFPVLSESAWMELVMQLLRRTPAHLPVFRVFTDSPAATRLAPKAEFRKGEFLQGVAFRMRERGWRQGDRT